MTQVITAVGNPHIEHGVLLELTLPDAETGAITTHYISNCYCNVTYNAHTYIALGGFLEITDIQGDLQSTNNEISLGLSAIPSQYIESILGRPVKGGAIKVFRVFFDTTTQLVISGQVFLRFNGVITNFAVSEDIASDTSGDVTHTITVTASSILGVLENRVAGRRTNNKSYQVNYGEAYINAFILADPAMNRIETLKNASFDFGKDPNK